MPRGIPEVGTFETAADYLDAPSAGAVWLRFRRGLYPAEFLIPLTPHRPGVRVRDLVAWIKTQRYTKAEKARQKAQEGQGGPKADCAPADAPSEALPSQPETISEKPIQGENP